MVPIAGSSSAITMRLRGVADTGLLRSLDDVEAKGRFDGIECDFLHHQVECGVSEGLCHLRARELPEPAVVAFGLCIIGIFPHEVGEWGAGTGLSSYEVSQLFRGFFVARDRRGRVERALVGDQDVRGPD